MSGSPLDQARRTPVPEIAADQLAQVRLSNAANEALDATTTFAIMLSHRQGMKLLDMVETNDTVTLPMLCEVRKARVFLV